MINARYTIVLKTLLDDPKCKKLITSIEKLVLKRLQDS